MDDWAAPTNLTEAWQAASRAQRRWVVVALGIFIAGMVVWVGGWFLPAHALTRTWWLLALGWVPALAVVTFGITLLLLMKRPIRQVGLSPQLTLTTQWLRIVHELTKPALDRFESEVALLVASQAPLHAVTHEFDALVESLSAVPIFTPDEIITSIREASTPWQPILFGALHEVVRLEEAGAPRRSYFQRLRAAPREVKRRARWAPALFAVAIIVVFASVFGAIVLQFFGLVQEWKLGSGTAVGVVGGLIIAGLGSQMSALPDTSRTDKLRTIADSLRAGPEQLS